MQEETVMQRSKKRQASRRKIMSVTLAAGLFLGGCGQLPTPGSLVVSPSDAEVAREEAPAAAAAELEEYRRIAREFLPEGATLVAPQPLVEGGGGTRQPVLPADLDGDSRPELAVGYRLGQSPPVAAVMVVQQHQDQWRKVWEKEAPGRGLEHLEAADITGDGRPELLVGWSIGASAGNGLDILTWHQNTLQEIASPPYHRLEVADLKTNYGTDGKAELAIWIKDTGDAFAVGVWRWDGYYLAPAEDAYPAYFPTVVNYYEERVQEMPDAGFYWYYLADARLKAQDPAGALEAIDKGLALGRSYPEPAKFLLVKGRALTALGRYQEAIDVLTGAMDGKNFGTQEDQKKQKELPFLTRLVAEAYYYRGEAYLGMGDYVHALEDWTKAVQMQPDWDPPAKATERLALQTPASVIEGYWQKTTPDSYPARLEGFAAWAEKQEFPGGQKLSARAVEAELASSYSDLPRVLLVDWTRDAAVGNEGHSIIWWQDGELHSQAMYSTDYLDHGLDQSHTVLQARVAPGSEGTVELGVVYDETSGGSGSPQPVFYLWRLEGDNWRVVWRSDSAPREWRNSHGTLRFTGPDLTEFTLQSDSWLVGDGKGEIFHEANPGPHRQFLDTWQRAEDGYHRVGSATLPAAYNTLVELVYALSTGQEEEAKGLVTDPALVEKARSLGLVQEPLGQGWMLELNDLAVERTGPLKILDGPAAGVTVEFEEQGGRWLVHRISKEE